MNENNDFIMQNIPPKDDIIDKLRKNNGIINNEDNRYNSNRNTFISIKNDNKNNSMYL